MAAAAAAGGESPMAANGDSSDASKGAGHSKGAAPRGSGSVADRGGVGGGGGDGPEGVEMAAALQPPLAARSEGTIPKSVSPPVRLYSWLTYEDSTALQLFQAASLQFRALLAVRVRGKVRLVTQRIWEIIFPVAFVVVLLLSLLSPLNSVENNRIYADETLDAFELQKDVGQIISEKFEIEYLRERLEGLGFGFNLSSMPIRIQDPSEVLEPADDPILKVANSFFNYRGPSPIPPFDVYVGAHVGIDFALRGTSAQATLERVAAIDNSLGNLAFLGKLSFAARNPLLRPAVDRLVTAFNESYYFFDNVYGDTFNSEEDAVADVRRRNAQNSGKSARTWALLVFDELDVAAGRVDYAIRMNYSVLPSTEVIVDRFSIAFRRDYQRYYLSGFLTLQQSVEKYLLGSLGDGLNSNISYTVTGTPFPTLAHNDSPYVEGVQVAVGLVLVVVAVVLLRKVVASIVIEKQQRQTETWQLMGLFSWPVTVSFFLVTLIHFAVIASLLALAVRLTIWPRSDFVLVFVFFLLFLLSAIALSYLVSHFLEEFRLAALFSPVIICVLALPRYLVDDDLRALSITKGFTCLLSPLAFLFGTDILSQYENARIPLNWRNVMEGEFSMATVLIFMGGDAFIYSLLVWYLQRVFPVGRRGARKWYFLCTRSYWRNRIERHHDGAQLQRRPNEGAVARGQNNVKFIEKTLEHVRRERAPPVAADEEEPPFFVEALPDPLPYRLIAVRNASLTSSRRDGAIGAPLRDVSATFMEGEVTAIIGRRVRSKTALIALLTGATFPDNLEGTCELVEGQHREQGYASRHCIGLCRQGSILSANLTVRQHIVTIAKVQFARSSHSLEDAESEAEKIIKEFELQEECDQLICDVPGSVERRVSVAMALVGDPKIVLLDQPDVGLEPRHRHIIWSALHRRKSGRVIVVSTQYTEDALLLADRVLVLNRGCVGAFGTPEFVMKQFGVGFIVQVTLRADDDVSVRRRADQLAQSLRRFAPNAQAVPRLCSQALKSVVVVVPFAEAGHPVSVDWAGVSRFMSGSSGEAPFPFASVRLHSRSLEHIAIAVATEENLVNKTIDLAAMLSRDAGRFADRRRVPRASAAAAAAAAAAEAGARATGAGLALAPAAGAGAAAASGEGGEACEASPRPGEGEKRGWDSTPGSPGLTPLGPVALKPPLFAGSDSAAGGGSGAPARVGSAQSAGAAAAGSAGGSDMPSLALPESAAATPTEPSASSGGQGSSSDARVAVVGDGASTTSSTRSARSWTATWRSAHPQPWFCAQVWAMLLKRQRLASHRFLRNCLLLLAPAFLLWLVLLTLKVDVQRESPFLTLDTRLFGASAPLMELRLPPQVRAGLSPATVTTAGGVANSFELSQRMLREFRSHSNERFAAVIAEDVVFYKHKVSLEVPVPLVIMHNTTCAHAWPAAQAQYFQALFRSQLDNPNALYRVRNEPLPLTDLGVLYRRLLLTLVTAFFILLSLIFIPATYVRLPLLEKLTGARKQQILGGVSPLAYWLGHWIADTFKFVTFGTIIFAAFVAQGVDAFVGTERLQMALYLLFMSYGVAFIPTVYALSFVFRSHRSAPVKIGVLAFFVSFILVVVSLLLSFVREWYWARLNDYVRRFVFRLLPPFVLGEGILLLASLPILEVLDGVRRDPLEYALLGKLYIYLCSAGLVFILLTVALEHGLHHRLVRYWTLGRKLLRRLASNIELVKAELVPKLASLGPVAMTRGVTDGEVPHARGGGAAAAPGGGTTVFSGGTAMGQFSGGGGVAGVGVAQDAPPPVIIRRQQSEPVNMLAPPMHRRARSDSPVRGAASGDDSLHPFHEQLLADTTVREEAERVNASPKKYALALRHVSVLFPERGGRGLPPRAALFNVTLGVRRNECLGVLGVGAVGKSTLLEVMAGALPPTSGEALLLGRPLVPAEVRGVIGFCGQRNALFRELRVSEMLELRAGVIRASRQEVLRVVEALGLSGCLQERCGHLPPPVQRLVSLAIALMATPPVIVLDEPTLGVDESARPAVWKLISEIRERRRATIILATTSIYEAEALCDRIAVLERELLFVGPPPRAQEACTPNLQVEIFVRRDHENAAINVMNRFNPNYRMSRRYALVARSDEAPSAVRAGSFRARSFDDHDEKASAAAAPASTNTTPGPRRRSTPGDRGMCTKMVFFVRHSGGSLIDLEQRLQRLIAEEKSGSILRGYVVMASLECFLLRNANHLRDRDAETRARRFRRLVRSPYDLGSVLRCRCCRRGPVDVFPDVDDTLSENLYGR